MKMALVNNHGVVTNMVEVQATDDGGVDYTPAPGLSMVQPTGDAQIGSRWNGTSFDPPEPVPPTRVEALRESLRDGTATLQDVIELLVIRGI